MHYGDPVLGLPDAIRACLFDLDGVLTPTALIHAAAWKEMFDAFLGEYQGAGYTPFDKVKDYDKSLDAYKHALDLKPDYPNAHEYMARTYLAMGNKDAAMREYEILKRLDPKMADELLKAIQANNADLGDND